MASNTKMPEPAFRLKWKLGAYYVSEPNIDDTDCYTADQLQAYAAGIRAEVLGEVRAVIPERVECVSEGDAGYNACRAEMLQALATLENPNE